MDYLKIIELTNKCQLKRQQANECYRMIGHLRNNKPEVVVFLQEQAEDYESDLRMLEMKLIKMIESNN